MSDNTITGLRDLLFETARALRSNESGMSVEKARAIGELGGRLIDSAKVEVEMLKTLGRGRFSPTGFVAIEHKDSLDQQDASGARPPLPAPEAEKRPKPHIRNPMGQAPRGAL